MPKLASPEPKKAVLFFVLACAVVLFVFSARQSWLVGEAGIAERDTLDENPDVLVEDGEAERGSEPAQMEVVANDVPQEVVFLFGGDLQFDRYIRQQAGVHGGYEALFVGFDELFASVDGVIANLEGPVTDFESVSVGSLPGSHNNYLFTFSPEVVPALKKLRFVLLNLGNNHILNFGQEGLAQTRAYLEQAGLAYWGNVGGDTWLEDSFILFEKNNTTFLFVNYNQFLWGDVDMLLAEMAHKKAELQPDFVVVYTHWGTEYQVVASEFYRELARRFVAAGADMVVGSHPHVVQQSEVVDGAPVYYSLGNFVFDQYFEEAVRRGLLLKVRFQKGSEITVEEFPVYLETTGKTVLRVE